MNSARFWSQCACLNWQQWNLEVMLDAELKASFLINFSRKKERLMLSRVKSSNLSPKLASLIHFNYVVYYNIAYSCDLHHHWSRLPYPCHKGELHNACKCMMSLIAIWTYWTWIGRYFLDHSPEWQLIHHWPRTLTKFNRIERRGSKHGNQWLTDKSIFRIWESLWREPINLAN